MSKHQQRLLSYLEKHKVLQMTDVPNALPGWTESRVRRIVNEFPDDFVLNETGISRKSSTTQPIKTTVRTDILNQFQKLIVGPIKENEELGEWKRPMSLYLTGKLVPIGSSSVVVNEEELEVDTYVEARNSEEEDYTVDRDVFRPSSMGISFKMAKLGTIRVKAGFAIYEGESHKRQWFEDEFEIEITGEGMGTRLLEKPGKVTYKILQQQGYYHVSLFLTNRYVRENQYPKQDEVMFQTTLSTDIPSSSLAKFHSKRDKAYVSDELLYRNVEELARGHSVGVMWEELRDVYRISTTWTPFYELPIVEHRTIPTVVLQMKELSEMEPEPLRINLHVLTDTYRQWLKDQREVASTLEPHLRDEAFRLHDLVSAMIDRMESGIQAVTSDQKKLQAFRFANESMMLQQAQSKVAHEYRTTKKRINPSYKGQWRLFQLLFLIMNIDGTSDPTHQDREIVDLIWFPTGGGKTEAYLGVAAYVMAYRRLTADVKKPEQYAGVTVMMRYTLRLLTIQQFQRAAALICAAEYIRRCEPSLYGKVPFSLGLWVGDESAPNKFSDAVEVMKKIEKGEEVSTQNPMQLMACPWCGEVLTPKDYYITEDKQRICCSNSQCEFHAKSKSIPVYTIDDAIYQHVPTMLIGTVDKIAQLPWKGNMHELFGRKNQYKGDVFIENDTTKRGFTRIDRLKPPSLLIQDELHLISGPLGSMTGLYEVTVDLLCQDNDGIGPKIIASTATIRGAERQVRALYGRSLNQFPLAITTADDTFVSKTVPVTERPGRLYVGVCAPGVSGKIQTIHTYAALMDVTRKMDKETIDPYWTLLGYFNTMKELASTNTTLKDEIPARLGLLDPKKAYPHVLIAEELTSRKKSKEIPEILERLEQTVHDTAPLDVVLATNMVSVGVDISRLGLMVVHGQPKTTAEYIQATSRVGRQTPGIVFTILNSLRSRDLSHFEQFISYHQAIYRHVEPMSVTPFATGALAKGLVGSFVGWIRQMDERVSKDKSVNKIVNDAYIQELIGRFAERIRKTNIDAEIELQLQSLIEWWVSLAENAGADSMQYSLSKYAKSHLLYKFDQKPKTARAKPAMMSLRNVEGSITIEGRLGD